MSSLRDSWIEMIIFFPTYWNILFLIQSKSWALLWANYNSDIKDEHSTCMYKITLIIYKGCSSMTKSKVIFFFFFVKGQTVHILGIMDLILLQLLKLY